MKSRTFVRVLLLTAVLIAAFGIGERYSGFTSAQSRQKWEYQVVKADRIVDNRAGTTEIKGLGKLGEDGWEAIGMNESWVLLKRSR
jgi:hypothetical protein